MFVIIVWIGPIFKTLPRSVLSCIVIVNLRSMFLQFLTIPTMWRRTRPDCIVWLVSFFGVMLFGVVGGLASGIIALMGSLVFNLINSTQFKPIGQYQQSEYYFDNTSESEIYEFTGPLNFATADNLKLAESSKKKNQLLEPTILIVMSKVTAIDFVGGNALIAFIKNKNVHLIDVPVQVRSFLDNYDDLKVTYHGTVIDARHHIETNYQSTEKC